MNDTGNHGGSGGRAPQRRKLRTLELFSGCGGLGLGFEQSGGFEVVAANEFWGPAADSYRANRPNTTLVEGDIALPETKRAIRALFDDEPCEAVIGGFPCQPFSVCGKRKATDPRASLYEDYLDVVRRLRPLVVAMENVPGILTMARPDGTPVMGWIANALRRLGYAVGYRRLRATDYGVPQARERVFILAWRIGTVPRIEPTHDKGGGNGLPAWRTLRDAVEGLPESPKDFLPFPERRLRFLRMLKAGQDWRDLPAELQAEAMGKAIDGDGGMTSYYRRLSWDRPSPTVTCCPTGKSTGLCHPDEDRPLSVQECRRVQQLPDDYVLCGSIADRYAQIGNAVPVGLARAVALAVRETLPADPLRPGNARRTTGERLLSDHVSKKGPDVLAFSIAMPGGKCPFASATCSKYCYANRGRFPLNAPVYERNLRATQDDGFVARICSELGRRASRTPHESVACAIHEKGDFHSLDYLRKWGEVIERMASVPNLRFFVYTRAWVSASFRRELERIGGCSNVRVNLSADREMLAERGLPPRIGDGLVTYLAETDDDLPAWPVDLVFRNLCEKPTSPLERIAGCLVCPHESNLYVAQEGGVPVIEGCRTQRIRCQECRICIDRSLEQWESLKEGYAGAPNEPLPLAQAGSNASQGAGLPIQARLP